MKKHKTLIIGICYGAFTVLPVVAENQILTLQSNTFTDIGKLQLIFWYLYVFLLFPFVNPTAFLIIKIFGLGLGIYIATVTSVAIGYYVQRYKLYKSNALQLIWILLAIVICIYAVLPNILTGSINPFVTVQW